MPHHPRTIDDFILGRRDFLRRTGMGFGAMGLAGLLGPGALTASAGTAAGTAPVDASHPLAARMPHFAAKAKRIIFVFMNGGPSHVDSFDPKPALKTYEGKMLPTENLSTERKTGAALPSFWEFRPGGQSGIPVSDLFPNLRECVDDMCIVRSMHADVPNHEPSLMLMNCGEARLIRPSMGSWLTYGLGTENEDLPGFISMCPDGYPIQESQNWQSAFLPGVYQGTYINTRNTEIEKLVEDVKNNYMSLRGQRKQQHHCCSKKVCVVSGSGPALRQRRDFHAGLAPGATLAVTPKHQRGGVLAPDPCRAQWKHSGRRPVPPPECHARDSGAIRA